MRVIDIPKVTAAVVFYQSYALNGIGGVAVIESVRSVISKIADRNISRTVNDKVYAVAARDVDRRIAARTVFGE